MWCHCNRTKRTSCCQVAGKYARDYKKAQLKRWRTCREALWRHVHSQSGMKFSLSYSSFPISPRILDYLYFRIRHSLAHLRPVILSADWSISRLQSWTCSSLSTVAEFVKLTQSIVIEIQRQSADLYKVQLCNRQFFCGVHSGFHGKGIRVSPAWYHPVLSH